MKTEYTPTPLLSPFQEKYHIVYGLFFGKKQDVVTSQRVRFKI